MRIVFASFASVLAVVVSPIIRGARFVLQAGIRQEIREDQYNYIIEVKYFGETVGKRYLSKRKAGKIYE